MTKPLDDMSLEEKVGQLFTFYYSSTTYSEVAEQCISELKAGGMFLDMQSLDTPEQIHELTARMQTASLQRGSGIPLFIAADFVAGAGCKLPRGGAVHFPKNMAVGAANDEQLAYESSRITAVESLAMGVNFNYSPVVDINNNSENPVIGTHSFGDSLEIVSRMGSAVIKGYQEHGMIATAKHFPGHGDTNIDSHHDLPVLSFDRERLESFELAPFRSSIEAGVEAIMVGHIAVPALDPKLLPASLSYPMITELLRGEMGFDGLVVTDGMSMKGVTSAYTQVQACVMALQAGVDLLLVDPANMEEARAMIAAIIEAIGKGELDEERINRSVARILQTKEKYNLTSENFKKQSFDNTSLELAESKQISLELGRKALRLHGNEAMWNAIGNTAAQWKLICDHSLSQFSSRMISSTPVAEMKRVEFYDELPDELLQTSKQSAVLVAITYNKRMRRDVLDQLDRFAEQHTEAVVLIHFGSPYDAEWIPNVPALLMYDSAPALQVAAAEYMERILKVEGSGENGNA